MTSGELVKAVLTAENTHVFDVVRINNIVKNTLMGYGKLVILTDSVAISYPAGKGKKITYFIKNELLSEMQLNNLLTKNK